MTRENVTIIPVLPGRMQEECLRFFRKCAANDPFNAVFCVPTIRLASTLRRQMGTEGIPHIPILVGTPKDLAKEVLVRAAPDLRIIPGEEARILMHQAIRTHPGRGILTPGGKEAGQRLVQDLSRLYSVITERGINYPACLGAAKTEKSQVLGEIFADYRSRLTAAGVVDGPSVCSAAADALAHTPLPFSGCIYGIHAPLPETERFLIALSGGEGHWMLCKPAGANPAIFGSEALPTPETGDGPEWLFSETEHLTTPVPITCGRFPDRRTEFQAIAQEISELISAGTRPSDIAVALTDIRAEEGRIVATFRDFGIPAASSATLPLAQEPLVQALLLPFRLAADDFPRETMVQLFRSPYYQFRHQDGCPVSSSAVNRYACEAGIRGGAAQWKKQFSYRKERLREVADELNTDIFNREEAAREYAITERIEEAVLSLIQDLRPFASPKTIAGHIRALRDVYYHWDAPVLPPAPDEGIARRESRALREYSYLLDRLGGGPGDEGPIMSVREAVAVLTAAVADARPEYEPDPNAVQLCGIRELQGLKIPHVFIADLTDGRLPDIPPLLPYTTEEEERAMGTMRRREKLREERYYFLAALFSAERALHLSHSEKDGGVLIPSPFFAATECTMPHESWICTEMPASTESRMERAGRCIQSGYIPPTEWLPEGVSAESVAARITAEEYHRQGPCDSPYDGIIGGELPISEMLAERYPVDTVWSATTLEDYVNCPFRFYLRHVLGLKPLPEEEREISAAAYGTIVHEVCQIFYGDWMKTHTTGPRESDRDEAVAQVCAQAETVLARHAREGALWEADVETFLGTDEAGPGLFEEFILTETEHSASPFVPSLFEAGFGSATDEGGMHDKPVPLPVPGGPETLYLRGFIDRVDRTTDGLFLVTDYKTGGHPKQGDILSGTALQLALYIRALEVITGESGVGASYYKMKRREVKNAVVIHDPLYADLLSSYRPQGMKKNSPPFPEVVDAAVLAAAEAAAGIRGGRFPLQEETDKCPGYCEYNHICRNNILRSLAIRRNGGEA